VALAFGWNYPLLLTAVATIGVGSAIFHPEASRTARAASGGRYGFAQSLFQVGGNFGQSLGPLMAAFIVVPFGQRSVLAFTVLAFAAVLILTRIAQWHAAHPARRKAAAPRVAALPRAEVIRAMTILVVLVFSKVFYLASLQSYYTFYLIQTFHVSVQASQVMLFVFLRSATVTGASSSSGCRSSACCRSPCCCRISASSARSSTASRSASCFPRRSRRSSSMRRS
jgi:FSR family fosmidomycin resistance protein-like MFS transporter